MKNVIKILVGVLIIMVVINFGYTVNIMKENLTTNQNISNDNINSIIKIIQQLRDENLNLSKKINN
ncbi:MAG: hypothetical protein KKA19_09850, partial [Candidatus Margulisbacteria bacterium]|nr:hypothetical protein [Candidatus Margulisiibacteriota bacterium]